MQRWKCDIPNSTQKSFVWSMTWISKIIILKTGYFQLWFLYKSNSTAGKCIEIIRIKHFLNLAIDTILHIIDQIKVTRVILEIGHCHLCIEVLKVHLKLRLQSLEGQTKQGKYYLCRISFGILWIFAKWSKSNIWNYFSLSSNAFLKSKFASPRTYTISELNELPPATAGSNLNHQYKVKD